MFGESGVVRQAAATVKLEVPWTKKEGGRSWDGTGFYTGRRRGRGTEFRGLSVRGRRLGGGRYADMRSLCVPLHEGKKRPQAPRAMDDWDAARAKRARLWGPTFLSLPSSPPSPWGPTTVQNVCALRCPVPTPGLAGACRRRTVGLGFLQISLLFLRRTKCAAPGTPSNVVGRMGDPKALHVFWAQHVSARPPPTGWLAGLAALLKGTQGRQAGAAKRVRAGTARFVLYCTSTTTHTQ